MLRKFAARGFSRFLVPAFCLLFAAAAPLSASALPTSSAADGAPMPGEEFWQSGFQEGMLGALMDLENHRQPDAANREEFQHPHVPNNMQGLYQQGFRRGYDAAVSKLTSRDFRSWVEGLGGENRQTGFRDGVAGAIKDFGNKRRPDPNNRAEYRHPPVPHSAQIRYRDGFEQGYEWAFSQLIGDDRDRGQ